MFKYQELGSVEEISSKLNGKKLDGKWITSRPSKYSKNEVFIQYWQYEDVEESVKKVFSEDDADEIVSFLKENGKTKVLKRTYCFINVLTKTLEVYRGFDSKTLEIVSLLQNFLKTKFTRISVTSKDLQKIYSDYSSELRQAMFKNVSGLIYEILRGNILEKNEKYQEYLKKFPEALRVISFKPKIRFLNGYNKYQVTINGDRGTVKFSDNGIFNWRPRFEIRQVTFFIATTLGLLKWSRPKEA